MKHRSFPLFAIIGQFAAPDWRHSHIDPPANAGTWFNFGEELQFAYETPFGSWTVRNAVHLPSDKVLFQLGDDQICGFDPAGRRVALLWHGRGPVPVIEKRSSNSKVRRIEATGGIMPQGQM